ncbi:UDP-N-acetylmuramoyl-L-alanyl-D-glutamate--2,6-diaminopimelate ligase [candidate division KSB1 bacterium]|nr:UDP-N-acetylmuramoyl-L-alanyl-D-glutamate--2,6-diaminopimelate ligase [candidate division KSB1 bacterium]
MKTLQSILKGIETPDVDPMWQKEVLGITADSREVKLGWVFFAIPGFQSDGHDFISDAIRNGALAVVAEKQVKGSSTPIIIVDNSRKATAEAARRFYDVPFENMTLIGITGTNGKTTSTYMMESILNEVGLKTGIVGTVQYRWADKVRDAVRTTPDAIEIYSLLREMADEGVQAVALEVSSHALSLDRVLGIPFKAAIFTNLSRDHLDFHKTPEAYAEAKSRLFAMLDGNIGVINGDDAEAVRMKKSCTGHAVLFGESGSGLDYVIKNVHFSEAGSSFTLSHENQDYDFVTPLWGHFNVFNAAGVSVAALELEYPLNAIQAGLKKLDRVPGRMEGIQSASGFRVVVDYAHTPDALENVLQTARDFTSGKLITVFGCGGDRDKGKRPEMGAIGEAFADRVFITSDNPRTENPDTIIQEILAGLKNPAKSEVIPNRREAIEAALRSATEGDTVMIAGKGHETYQEIMGKRTHFDDREIAISILKHIKG